MTTAPSGPDPRNAAPPGAARLLRAAFGAVARRRPGARAVHNRGALFAGVLEVPERSWESGVDLFDTPGRWPAVVRFSRGFGLPRPLPDVLGLAVRVASPAGLRDVLVDSALGRGPWQRRLGRPGQDHLAATYSSLLSYRIGGGKAPVLLLALPPRPSPPRPAEAGAGRLGDLAVASGLAGACLDLALAARGGGPVTLARLRLGERLPDGTEPRFDPTASGSLRPGPLGRLRVAAYPGAPVAQH
ncbi:MAG: phosphodiesterase [Actinomycetota bacterium]|nr:phosphodiesterase [Actinomycetota bacterium]